MHAFIYVHVCVCVSIKYIHMVYGISEYVEDLHLVRAKSTTIRTSQSIVMALAHVGTIVYYAASPTTPTNTLRRLLPPLHSYLTESVEGLHLLRAKSTTVRTSQSIVMVVYSYLTESVEGPHLVRARSKTKRHLPHVQLLPRHIHVIHEESP